jgi:transcriptional regulator with XRE-family HTH domain
VFYESLIMRSTVADMLPNKIKRGLNTLGADLALARRKRRFTAEMMAERLGVAKSTYLKIERGDASVSMGAYAMALFVLGFDAGLARLADPSQDDQGLLLDAERVPKRVRPRKARPEL